MLYYAATAGMPIRCPRWSTSRGTTLIPSCRGRQPARAIFARTPPTRRRASFPLGVRSLFDCLFDDGDGGGVWRLAEDAEAVLSPRRIGEGTIARHIPHGKSCPTPIRSGQIELNFIRAELAG